MRKFLLIALCLVVLAAGICWVLKYTPLRLIVYVVLHRNPGPFDRKNMEAIVAQVRLMKLKPGEEKVFKLDHLTDPESLHAYKQDPRSADGSGLVEARLSSSNKLTMVICTSYQGHAGSYGFAYSDVPLVPEPFGDGSAWLTLDVPSHINMVVPGMKIDEHWWKVENNLD